MFDGAGDMAGPAVEGHLAPIAGFGHGVDEPDGAVVDGGEHLVPVGDQLRPESGRELFRRSVGRLGRQRSILGGPGPQPAVEHRRPVESDPAQHPPDARGPDRAVTVVQHHPGIVADTQRAHGGTELLRRRHGEPVGAVAVGQITHEVGEPGGRDVAALVVGPATQNLEAAAFFHLHPDGAVEHHQIRVIEVLAQPLRRHQRVHRRRLFRDRGLVGLWVLTRTGSYKCQSCDQDEELSRTIKKRHPSSQSVLGYASLYPTSDSKRFMCRDRF